MVLIEGVNDAPEHAHALLALLAPLRRVKVNLIAFNPTDGLRGVGARFRPSPPENVTAFQRIVMEGGIFCTTRRQRGAEDAAACGMLATRARAAPRERKTPRHKLATSAVAATAPHPSAASAREA
jgi:23S rRNA (adenine2503-C2)-methyltransferase